MIGYTVMMSEFEPLVYQTEGSMLVDKSRYVAVNFVKALAPQELGWNYQPTTIPQVTDLCLYGIISKHPDARLAHSYPHSAVS